MQEKSWTDLGNKFTVTAFEQIGNARISDNNEVTHDSNISKVTKDLHMFGKPLAFGS